MRELRFEIGRQYAEPLSDLLLEAGALSVAVEDADADSPDEQPLFGEPGMEHETPAWQRNQLVVLLGPEQDAAALLADACAQLGVPVPAYTESEVPDQDWVRVTQAQFEPIQIGARLWIVPSWHAQPEHADALVLQLDPGVAFGTGSHPTTRLCLRWLEQQDFQKRSVLDYGCGSGILALAACRLGAATVFGLDIDPQAVAAAQHNNEVNRCHAQFGLPEEIPAGTFGVVVANILSSPLKLLAPMLCARVAPGGALVLSGILARQTDEVIAAYAPYMTLSCWAEDEGWVCLHGIRH
ncbi:MAG: 50S ribosomal protein L11 methyltransferase [Burkholderiaceae bacterium]|nr:MAG: 50S ribosomal protein L11 methyltransferase [Burkholderiaceae bacterium]